MFFPTGDDYKPRTAPLVNSLLIVANVVVFFLVFRRPMPEVHQIVDEYALKPDEWQRWQTLFTSMFLHGDLLHLGFNMLFLWIAGDNVEDVLGHLGYLVFYLAAGLAGSAAHVYSSLAMTGMGSVPTVGASGAISGVVGAYLIFFPKIKINFRLFLFIFFPRFRLPAWGAIALWAGSQLLMARQQFDGLQKGESMMVAVFAHLGGFVFGFVIALLARLVGAKPPPKANHG